MKKVWDEYRAFLVTLIVVSAVGMVFAKIAVPQWMENLALMGVGFFVGARTANKPLP